MNKKPFRPTKVNILGITHTIEYLDNPSEVDIYKRESLFGQIDFWTRTIRVYDNGRSDEDIMHTVIHEVLHGLSEQLKLKAFNGNAGHDELDILSLALTDVFVRNEWIKL